MKESFKILIAILMVMTGISLVASPGGSAQNNQQQQESGKNQKKFRKSAKPVRDQYIVVLKSETPADDVEPITNEFLGKHGGNARHIYKHTIKGFSIQLPEAAAIALSRDPRVEYVQEDTELTLEKTETTTSWHLDRIDQRNNQRDNSYYFPNAENGAGVHAYIIDSGIRLAHREFITNGINRASNDVDFLGGNGDDCLGHGTAVASLLGGNTFGSARAVRLHGLRIFDCNANAEESDAIAAVDWVTANHIKPAVVNMSLGMPATNEFTSPLENAIRYSILNGITYVVAAGNEGDDAITRTPARIPEVITVGATNDADAKYNLSNFGARVDLFAPGEDVISASILDVNGDGIFNDATPPWDGTSLAAPLVAGVAARFLQVVPNAAPSAVQGAVISTTTRDVLTNLGDGSPNRMLFADLRHAFLGQQIKTVSESAWEVDSGVDLGPGQWLAMTGTGVIYSGQLTWFPNGPEGWTFPADSSNFPVPSAHPYSLTGHLWGGDGFYIGVSNALIQDVANPTRLLLRTNDMMPGDGAGAFTCKTELWQKLPEARADFVSQNIPNPMLPGSLQFARITMRNVGPTMWVAGTNIKLSLEGGGMTWGRNEVILPHDVAPQTNVDFNFDFTAPLVPGTYNFQWRMMQQGVQRFGDVSTNIPIKVLSLSNDAEFISQDVPKTMYATESYWVSVTMKNTGATVWPAGSVFRLGSQNPQDNTTWGMNRVQLFQTVQPLQQVTFTFEVTAPVTTGKKNFQWRMVKEGVEWFGATTPNVEVSVKPHPCPGC